MYKVAICDDEAAFRWKLARLVKETLHKAHIPFTLEQYPSCDALDAAVAGGAEYHLFFLDILMEGMDGMEFARKLREQDESCTIIFITVTHEYIRMGYDVIARQYIEKPFDPEEIEKLLLEDYEKRFRRTYVRIHKNHKALDVPVDSVLFIEAKLRQGLYHLADGEEQLAWLPCSFEELGATLPPCFARCHRKYYVNLRLVAAVEAEAFLLRGGQRVPISRRLGAEAHKAYAAFCERRRLQV